MKTIRNLVQIGLLGAVLFALPAVVLAQFTITTNGRGTSCTITSYTGSGGAVNIPGTIYGLTVTGIGAKAFYDNTGLTSVMIGTNVTSIGYGPFADCTYLTAITVNASNPIYTSVDGVLFNKSQTTLIQYPAGKVGTSYTIPNSVISIGEDAFSVCQRLTSVTISTNVTTIGDGAFYFIPLTSVTIPNSVTNIGAYAFEECNVMTNVTIGNGVTSIGQFAFSTCVDLTAVYFYGSAPTEGAGAFINDANVTFYYLAKFSTQPASETVVLGGANVTFTAAISGTPTYQPTYQWQISTNGGATWSSLTDGSGITGSTTGTLTINNTTISLSGNQFRVVATNSAGTFISNASTLSVLTPVQLSYNFQTLRDPAAAGATIPTGISGGTVVGYYEDTNSIAHGFLYNIVTQTYTSVDDVAAGTATYQGTTAKAISGDNIVGSYVDASSIQHGFLYNVTTQNYTSLDDPFAIGSQGGTAATGIDGDKIVGYYFDGNLAWGFLYNISTQTYTTLHDPYAGSGSEFGGIDMGTYTTGISGGNIVGWYAADSGIDGGFLYNITTQTYNNLYLPDAWYGSEYGGGTSGIDGNNIIGGYFAEDGAQLGFLYNFATQTYATLDVPVAGNGPNAVTFPTGISGGNIVGYYDAGNGLVGFLATSTLLSYAVLTVNTNGVGSLSPNYNGAALQVGNSYAITATAGTGFVFTNWTGGTNLPLTVLTNGPTVQFVMASNLMLQANFVLQTGSFQLVVTTTSLPNATNRTVYNQMLSANGGQKPYSWTNSSGTLPAGLTLTTNGLISGTPMTNGTFNFTAEVTDALSATATQPLTLTVVVGPPIVTIQPTNNSVMVTLGSNVSFAVTTVGTGPFSYQWQQNGTNLPNGIITTVAGNGTAGHFGDGGVATNAELDVPDGVALDAVGNLFIADYYNYSIRKVAINGIINTVAGNRINGYSGDGGAATNAELSYAVAVAVDATGNIYIDDSYNNRLRKVGTNSIINTVAGNGNSGFSGDGGAAINAELHFAQGVAVDSTGNLLIADFENNRLRKVGTDGIINTVAGNGNMGFSGDGGVATNAALNLPFGVAVDSAGNLFIADQYNQRIRKVGINGTITTVAGNGTAGYFGDGGMATNAELYNPLGVAVDVTGNLFIADFYNNRIREVGSNGIITTVAGNGTGGYSGDGGAATNAELYNPEGVVVDTTGNLFIADTENNRIRKVVFSGPTFVLNNVGFGNAGAYDVVVSSPYGSVTSSVVNLTVTLPDFILSAPQATGGNTNFTFLLSGPAGSNYVLQVSTNLLNWNPVSTSTIPVSGSINLSNAINGYNRRFYRAYLQ